jgi:hypothetical protein
VNANGRLARDAERRRQRALALGPAAGDADLQEQQLLEREPRASGLGLVLRLRMVQRDERVALQRQPLAHPQLRGQGVDPVAGARQRRGDQCTHPLRRDLLAGGIDRCEVGRRLAVADVVGADVEAVASPLAAEPHEHARPELLLEPGLVEPCGADRCRAVADPCCDEGAPAPQRPLRDAQHLAGDGDLFGARERPDRDLLDRGLVATRPVLEQVAHRAQAELREPALQRRADARQDVELGVEALRLRTPARGGPGLGLVQACEDRLSTECRHRARRQSVSDVRSRTGRYARVSRRR